MAHHRIISQEPLHVRFFDEESGAQVEAACMVVSSDDNFLPMLLHRSPESVGFWLPNLRCTLITAWRALQLVKSVKRFRSQGRHGDTLSGIVSVLADYNSHERMQELAADFEKSVAELEQLIQATRNSWPDGRQVLAMWQRMRADEQDREQSFWARAIENGDVRSNQRLEELLQQSAIRVRTTILQFMREDDLVHNPLPPELSLGHLMRDLRMSDLLFTVGADDVGVQPYFDLDNMDHEVLARLIGSHGYRSEVELVRGGVETDSPLAHATGEAIHQFASRPVVIMPDGAKLMVAVRWDRVTERFQIALQSALVSTGAREVVDQWTSIADIRAGVGEVCGLGGPLPVGQIVQYPTNT